MNVMVIAAEFSDGETGGAELQARYLAESWAACGHEVHVLPIQMTRVGGGSERRGDLCVHWLGHPWYRGAGRRDLAGILRSMRPDVCYVRVLKPLWRLAPICDREGVPWVFNLYSRPHCERQWRLGAPLSRRALSTYVRKSLPDEVSKCFLCRAAAVIAQTDEQRGLLAASYGLQAVVIPNGHPIPSGPFPKATPPLVLWVGKDWKRPAAFVEMSERLRDTDARFVLVGGLPRDLAAAIDARKWANVTRVGAVTPEEVNRLFAQAVVTVNTSPVEGFPNTFIQAWMRETAVVSLSVDPDGVLSREGMGLSSGSVEQMAEDVRSLLTDEPLRRALVTRVREQAIQRHSLAQVAPAYLDLFESVLARRERVGSVA